MSAMQVHVLGPLRVGEDPVTAEAPRGPRPRDVLAVLVARRGRPVPAETILELVWGGEAANLTVATVHTVVARLRRQFGPGLVRTTDAGYVVPPDVAIDADHFSELAAAAHEAGLEPSAREALCRRALELWIGTVTYDGVACDLLASEFVRLEELHRRVRSDLAESLLTAPQPAEAGAVEALVMARGLAAENPLDEEAAVLAMRAAYRLGRQAEALEMYDELRRTLRDELGVDPSPAARAVHARILAHDAALGARRLRPVHPAFRLPVVPSPTVGRAAETAAVQAALRAGRRLVTVCGPGGVGKSRMLADVGAALAPDGPVAHISLAAHAGLTAEQLAAGVSVSSGLPAQDADAVEGLVRSLATGELTILVDEAEWAPDAAAEVAAAVLRGCPGVRVIVASRTALSLVGEHAVELGPLQVPAADDCPAAIADAPAVRLLAERLHDRGLVADPDPARLDEGSRRILAEAVTSLDGLPLALELVAGAAASLDGLLELVRRPLDLASSQVGRDPRQRSLRRTLTWSVDRLTPKDRRILRRLAVFAGPFTLAAARAVCGVSERPGAQTVERACSRLAAQHLLAVDRSGSPVSFRMLRTVRDLLLEELRAAEELEAARARHLEWFAGLWRDVPLSDALIEHVGRTYDDHFYALAYALETGADAEVVDLTIALGRTWLFTENAATGMPWVERALALPRLTPTQRARLEVLRAGLATASDWTQDEIDSLAAALVSDADWSVQLGLTAAIASYVTGNVEKALGWLDRTRGIAETRATYHLPEVVATQAAFDAAADRPDDAVRGAREALARIGTTPSAVHLVSVVPKAGLALLDAGRPEEALDVLASGAREVEERFGVQPHATTLCNIGWAALGAGQPEAAADSFARMLLGPHGRAMSVGEAAAGLGAAHAALGVATAAELLALSECILASEGNVLPPTLASHVADAIALVGSDPGPAGLTVDLAVTRVFQLITPPVSSPARP